MHIHKTPGSVGSEFALKWGMRCGLITGLAILALTASMGSIVHADEGLDSVLGLDRRLIFSNASERRLGLRTGAAMKRQDLPPKLMIPLQAVNESLVFLAAYQARNTPAMAAVGAMSLWGGTLRRVVDAVVHKATDGRLDVAGLYRLDVSHLKILDYLWARDEPVDDVSLYLGVRDFTDRNTMKNTLEAMQDLGVIEWKNGGVWPVATRDDVVRSLVAAGRTDGLVHFIRPVPDGVEP